MWPQSIVVSLSHFHLLQNKQTPLHLAAEYGQLEVSRTLLDLKADVNAMDNVSPPLSLSLSLLRPIFVTMSSLSLLSIAIADTPASGSPI